MANLIVPNQCQIGLILQIPTYFTVLFYKIPSRFLLQSDIKGQIISKANCQAQGFFKKMNENTSHTSKNEFIRSFFGRILGLTICFRN